jgi:integrase
VVALDTKREIAIAIEEYTGTISMPDAALSFAKKAVTKTKPSSGGDSRHLLWAVTRLVRWFLAENSELEAESVFHPATIERFVAVGFSDRTDASKRTVRSLLRKVSKANVPHLYVDYGAPEYSRDAPRAPYSDGEIEGFLRAARNQVTPQRRDRMIAAICLGVGTWLNDGELQRVRGDDVYDHDGTTVVRISGKRERVAPVRYSFAGPLMQVMANYKGRYLFGDGKKPPSRNAANWFFANLDDDPGLPKLEPKRLRATWLAHAMESTGFDAVVAMTGLKDSHIFCDVLKYLPAPGLDRIVNVGNDIR